MNNLLQEIRNQNIHSETGSESITDLQNDLNTAWGNPYLTSKSLDVILFNLSL